MNEPSDSAIRKSVRGSSLLLVGRFVSLGINFLGQVLTVRYLSKADYGALAYALSVAALFTNIGILGLVRGVTRFVPIYQVHEDKAKILGTLIAAISAICAFGLAVVTVTIGFQGLLATRVISDPTCLQLVLILIVLGPINALDNFFQALAAMFVGARAIFFRRHITTPLLKVLAILSVMAMGGSAYEMAIAHVIIGLIGIAIYIQILKAALTKLGLIGKPQPKPQFPLRELFAFSLPLVAIDFAMNLKLAFPPMALEMFASPEDIATYRAVIPVATLNLIVFHSFRFLYGPAASRFLAQDNHRGVASLYAKTAIWSTVLTYPVFLITCVLSDPIAILLFGDRYAESGPVLAILSAGSFINAAVGHNIYTLQVYGRVRFLTILSVFSGFSTVGLCVLLIPHYGAVGAAIAALCTDVLQSSIAQFGLRKCSKVRWISKDTWMIYAVLVATSATLIILFRSLELHPIVQAIATISVGIYFLRRFRDRLDIIGTFPEAAKIKALRFLLPNSPSDSSLDSDRGKHSN